MKQASLAGQLGRIAVLRVSAIVLGFGCFAISIHLIVRAGGPSWYAASSLIGTFAALIPFADLGLGFSLVNDVTDYASGMLDERVLARRLAAARDLLILVGAVVALAAVALGVTGSLPGLLGVAGHIRGASAAAVLTVSLIGASIPFGLGLRVLQGMKRIDLAMLVALAGPVVSLAVVILNYLTLNSLAIYTASTQTGLTLAAIVTYRIAKARLSIALPRPFAELRLMRTAVASIRRYGAAAFTVNVGIAVAFQSDRLILSHVSTTINLAEYSLVAQLYTPLSSVITMTAQTLWPHFRGRMNAGVLTVGELNRAVFAYAGFGLAGAALLGLAVRPFASITAGHSVRISVPTVIAAMVLLFVRAIHQPAAMTATRTRAMQIQAALMMLMMVTNVAISVVLARRLGAAGPYIGSAIAVLIFSSIPTYLLAVRLIRQSSAEAAPVIELGDDAAGP